MHVFSPFRLVTHTFQKVRVGQTEKDGSCSKTKCIEALILEK